MSYLYRLSESYKQFNITLDRVNKFGNRETLAETGIRYGKQLLTDIERGTRGTITSTLSFYLPISGRRVADDYLSDDYHDLSNNES